MSQPTPTLTELYLQRQLGGFFSRTPADLQAFLQEPRGDIDRAALSQALTQYSQDIGLPLSATLQQQLARLAQPHSRVVVAGQQAGLLGGPAYSVHKAADAILLARELDTDERPVLPVFWIASQDHDAAEVASTHLLDLSEREFHPTLPLPEGLPVGRVAWQPEWTAQVHELLQDFDAPAPHKAWVSGLLEAAMDGPAGANRPTSNSYADVFARLMFGLLGEHGLLVLDPLHPALAALMAPALARELQNPLAGPQRIEEAAERLGALGFTPQLRRPPGATNLFIEEDDGLRRLLRHDPSSKRPFSTAGQEYSLQQLQDLLQQDPSRLTPAAGLRPIVQDCLLPTAAFVVGPGELAYGAELRGVYELHGVPQPVLWPRLSVTWLEPNVARMLDGYGLSAKQFQKDPAQAIGKVLARQQQITALGLERLNTLEGQFAALTQELGELDPTLKASVERTQQRTLARLKRHQQQATAALARAEDVRTGHLSRLSKHLLPAGHPQEREMNFFTYLLKHGRVPLEMLLGQQAGAQVELRIP